MTGSRDDTSDRFDRDVVIVGGGPSGSSAAIFTARYGLDTVVFDRGNAALPRCAYLSNYLGFPAGIDVETFSNLLHDHVAQAGANYVADMVERVDRLAEETRAGDDSGFVVETQDGREVTTRYVIAAAWYDGEYLRALDGDDEMFELHEHHGEEHEHFDPDYPGDDGRTPIDGLYVAAPNGHRNAQAIVAAGHGAHVARSLIEDHRSDLGYPDGVLAQHYDWLRSSAEFEGEWADRERWHEWFENEAGDHDLSEERFEALRETYVDRAFETKLDDEAVAARTDEGLARLVETIGEDRVLAAIDDARILDAIEDDRIRGYLAATDTSVTDD